MASVEERKRTNKRGKVVTKFLVRWNKPNGSSGSKSFNNEAAAVRHKIWVEDELAAGRNGEPRGAGQAPRIGRSPGLKGDAVTAYVEHLSVVREPSTAQKQGYQLGMFERFLAETFRRAPTVAEFSRELLTKFHAWLGVDGGIRGSRTAETKRKAVEIATLLWKFCEDDERFKAFTPRVAALKLKRGRPPPPIAPRWVDMDRCIALAPGWYPFFLAVLRFTGLRKQQAMGLRLSDFDLERAHLLVRGELGKSAQESAGRVVAISAHFTELLQELVMAGKLEGGAPFLVKTSHYRGARHRAARDTVTARAWATAEVRREAWEGRPHHAFRKGVKSELTRAGADERAVEFMLGHDTGLAGIYTDPEALPQRDTVAKIPPLSEAARFAVLRSFDVVSSSHQQGESSDV